MRRLQMRKIAEALRLRAAGPTTRKIAVSLNVGQPHEEHHRAPSLGNRASPSAAGCRGNT